MIPDAAVEAAAMAILGVTPDIWEMQMPRTKERYLADARAALEAAAPHMLARTINTRAELDALDITAVIKGKWLAEKWADPEGEMWHVAGKGMNWDTEQIIQRGGLPAIVLLEPTP